MMEQRAGFRAAMLAISCGATLAASGCVQQPSQAMRSDGWISAGEQRAKATARCGDAERETRVLDLASSSGHLAAQEIRDVMRPQQAAMSDCFEQSLQRHPAFKGTITLLFAIEPNGSVSHTSVVHSDVADCQVAQCLRTHLARLSFPAPEGGAVLVQYPLRVQSQPSSASATASRR